MILITIYSQIIFPLSDLPMEPPNGRTRLPPPPELVVCLEESFCFFFRCIRNPDFFCWLDPLSRWALRESEESSWPLLLFTLAPPPITVRKERTTIQSTYFSPLSLSLTYTLSRFLFHFYQFPVLLLYFAYTAKKSYPPSTALSQLLIYNPLDTRLYCVLHIASFFFSCMVSDFRYENNTSPLLRESYVSFPFLMNDRLVTTSIVCSQKACLQSTNFEKTNMKWQFFFYSMLSFDAAVFSSFQQLSSRRIYKQFTNLFFSTFTWLNRSV